MLIYQILFFSSMLLLTFIAFLFHYMIASRFSRRFDSFEYLLKKELEMVKKSYSRLSKNLFAGNTNAKLEKIEYKINYLQTIGVMKNELKNLVSQTTITRISFAVCIIFSALVLVDSQFLIWVSISLFAYIMGLLQIIFLNSKINELFDQRFEFLALKSRKTIGETLDLLY